ncbi:MKRN2 opposite strand protein-like [Asterias amurensis]|uniref:MKRN2 opposite strand protein-like n=1 Tax=Asterias amurensis TaxID=7602 RepID=UPI003AB8E0B5
MLVTSLPVDSTMSTFSGHYQQAWQMSSSFQSVRSFSHDCQPQTKIFIFSVPTHCPMCGKCVDQSSVTSPVARYPSPFLSAHGVPYSLVIKPTVSDFLISYGPGQNLHTGLTTSKGSVYSFDESGVHLESTGWHQCLTVPLVEEYDEEMKNGWDGRLAEAAVEPQWCRERYQDDGHNCFDFVISFLNFIGCNPIQPECNQPITRENFCRDLIMPVTSRAAGYIGIYQSIDKYGFLVQQTAKR